MNKLELLCDIKNILGEGPYYDYRNGNIRSEELMKRCPEKVMLLKYNESKEVQPWN